MLVCEVVELASDLYKLEFERVLYRLLVLYFLVRPRATGVKTGRLAAQAPMHISTMTQKVGLKTCKTRGVCDWGGAL